jgi:hypothetical protein
LIFNLLPPPGSPPLQPDERGAAWSAPPLAVEVQAQVVDAMERVSACTGLWQNYIELYIYAVAVFAVFMLRCSRENVTLLHW